MKKLSIISILLFGSFWHLSGQGNYNQYFVSDTIIELPQEQNNWITARNRIVLKPGFSSTNGTLFKGMIDETIILPHDYLDDPITVFDRPLNTNLNVGTLSGNFEVSPTGAAIYNIPVQLPPATAGFGPQLSITYNSQAGVNGILGVGWNLAGLSSISRCGKTNYHDNETTGVTLTSDDRFAIDGQRLMLFNGVYGSAGSEYRTEQESFIKVTANGIVGDGPESFTVQTKEGLTLHYGNTRNSRIYLGYGSILSWMLDKVMDANGNYYTYTYKNDKWTGDFYIDEINYTANDKVGLDSYNKIKFLYDERSDKNTQYIIEYQIASNVILREIQIQSSGEKVRSYVLNYILDEYSKLQTITLKGENGGSMNSQVFVWNQQNGNNNFVVDDLFGNAKMKAANEASDKDRTVYTKQFVGDYNGDGKSDVLQMCGFTNNNGVIYTDSLVLYENQMEGITPLCSDSINKVKAWYGSDNPALYKARDFIFCDLNGDGLDDLGFITYTGPEDMPTFKFEAYVSEPVTPLNYSLHDIVTFSGDNRWISRLGFTDFNQDGRADIVFIKPDGNSYSTYIALSERTNNYKYPLLGDVINLNAISERDDQIVFGNFTGRGAEIAVLEEDGLMVYYYENGTFSKVMSDNSFKPDDGIYTGDFNGDGLTDILQFMDGTDEWLIRPSMGIEYFDAEESPLTFVRKPNSNQFYNLSLGDFNGDGKTDIFEQYCKATVDGNITVYHTDEVTLNVYYAKGNNIFEQDTKKHFGMGINDKSLMLGDFNGDGSIDVLSHDAILNYLWAYHLRTDSQNSRKISDILDGMNNGIHIKYTTIANDNVYEKTHANYYNSLGRLIDFQGGLYVVQQYVNSSSIIDITGRTSIKYVGSVLHKTGKGFLGFSKTTSTLSRGQNNCDDLSTIFEYDPSVDVYYEFCLNYLKSIETYIGAEKINTKEFVKHVIFLDDNHRRYIDNHSLFATSTDNVTGNKTKSFVDTFDEYNNPTSSTTEYYDGTQIVQSVRTTVNQYTSDGSWCAFKPDMVTTTKQRYNAGGTNPVADVAKVDYNYDPETGNLVSEHHILDATHSELNFTISYSDFLGFGLARSISIIPDDNSIDQRTSNVVYDSKGRYIERKTNNLGHAEFRTFDPKTGNLLTSTDANGLVTQNQYTEFGQLSKIEQPDGTISETKRNWTEKLVGTVNSPESSVWYQCDFNNRGEISYTFFDAQSREIREAAHLPVIASSEWIYTDTEYNILGQTSKKYQSFTSTPTKYTEYKYYTTGVNMGKLKEVSPPDDYKSTITYDGATTTTTMSDGKFSKTTLDASGLATSVTDNGGSITYQYYSNGKLSKIMHDGNETIVEYDKAGNRLLLNDPDAGIIKSRHNVYGELVAQQNANQADGENIPNLGAEMYTLFEYDGIGRLTSEKEVIGNYDAQSITSFTETRYVYDEYAGQEFIGNLMYQVSENCSSTYTYDQLGREINCMESILNNEKSFTFGYEYNSEGRLLREIYPNGFGVNYSYDARGYLAEKKDDAGITFYKPTNYNADLGIMDKYELGNEFMVVQHTYDNIGRLETISARLKASPSTIIQSLGYGYRSNGNLKFRTDYLLDKKEWFAFDDLNRLTGRQITNATSVEPSGYPNDIVYIDSRIKLKTDVGSYNYSNGEHAHAVSTITDLTGNTALASTCELTYTPFLKVQSITDYDPNIPNEIKYMEFTYGLRHERIKTVYNDGAGNSIKYYAFGGNYELRVDNVGNETALCYLDGNSVYYTDKSEPGNNKMLYLLRDHLGSITKVISGTNANNYTLEEQFSYDAWGQRRNALNWSYTNITAPVYIDRGFTAHEHLDNFSLINMNGRIYDPILGTFLSPDNYVQAPDYTQNFNRYSYVLNNPLKYTDPSGEFVWAPVIIGAVMGAYTGYKIADAKGYDMGDWQSYGYMLGGAVIGGLSGYVGATVSTGGGFMANTMGIIYSSSYYTMGMSAMSGGMMQPIVSFGFGSFDFGTGEFRSIFNWSDLSVGEKLGYSFGALANIQDIVAGVNGTTYNIKARPKLAGHSQGEGTWIEMVDGFDANGNPIKTPVNHDITISVGPADHSIGQGNGLKWEMAYVKRSLQFNSVKGENVAYIKPSHPQLVTKINNVNGKWLSSMTNRLNSGNNLLNTGALKYGLLNGCVNYASRSLLYSGVLNINALLPVTAPVLLNTELFVRQMGIYASPYIINY